VEFTVTQTGPTFDALLTSTARDLKQANRKAGREVGKVGKAAMAKGAPRMFGRALTAKPKVEAFANRCQVEFVPSPRQSGPWAIAESGRRGGYLVAPRRRRALRLPSGFAMSAHPGPVAGRKAWTRAGARLFKAVDRTVHDVYDDALEAG
jgi:hypothetical protein